MALLYNITADHKFFAGEDKVLRFKIFAADGTTPIDVSLWEFAFTVRKFDKSDDTLILKSSIDDISVTGTFNSNPSTNTQVVAVTFVPEDTFSLRPWTYRYSLYRSDDPSNTVLAYGDFTLLQSTFHDPNLAPPPPAAGTVYDDPDWLTSLSAAKITGVLTVPQGGTGHASYSIGDLLYASAVNAISALPDVAVGSVLTSGGVGAAPVWNATPALSALSLTTPLPATSGGTGHASYTTGDLVYASGPAALASLVDVAVGSVLISGGVGVAPAWSTTPSIAQVVTPIVGTTDSNPLNFWTNGGSRWQISAAGHLLASGDNALDIGAAGANRPRNLYFASQLRGADGAFDGPAYSFGSESSLGFYKSAASTVSLAVGGAVSMSMLASGELQLKTTSAKLSFNGDVVLLRDAAGILAQRNAANAQSFYIYNTFTDSSNYRRLKISTAGAVADITTDWAGTGTAWSLRLGNTWSISGSTGHISTAADNTNDIGATATGRPRSIYVGTSFLAPDGSAAAPGHSFSAEPATGIFRYASGAMAFSRNGTIDVAFPAAKVALGNNSQLTWASGTDPTVASADLLLGRDAAGILAQKNGTSAQIQRIYNTFTDASNYERVGIGWNVASIGNKFGIFSEQLGTGASRAVVIGTTGSTPVDIWTANTARWEFSSTGHLVAFNDGSYDIGNSGANRPRSLFLAGSVTAAFGATLGYAGSAATTSAGPVLSGVWLPRIADLSSNVLQDYQDEYAFLGERGATITTSPASTSGAAADMFHDDSNTLNWSTGQTGGTIQVTIDHSTGAGVVPNRNNGSYQIGLTYRSDFVGGTHIKIEAWNTAAGGSFSTVYDANTTVYGGAFGAWVSPLFVSPDASFNMYKTRITITVPDPTVGNFRIQRVMLYHATAPWDTFHLRTGGDTMYGNLLFKDATYDIGASGATRPRNVFVSSSIVNKTKAGTPTDSDVTNPADGMLVVDTTASKIWVRTGGAWKGVAVA